MKYIAILGRLPLIGAAELETVLDLDIQLDAKNNYAIFDMPDDNIPFSRFGSIIKIAKVQDVTITNTNQLVDALANLLTNLHPHQPGVKLKIGISDYSATYSAASLSKLGLQVKKILKNNAYSVRIVPNRSAKLGSAQIIHNNLVSDNGTECLIFKIGGQLHIATTLYEQDIEAYAARDQARPMRDARVGMLPPKLAQTIINLALGTTSPKNATVLDPFCGTGVVLQEALLMGANAFGTDIEPRMIDYSSKNIDWLRQVFGPINGASKLEVGDACDHTWQNTFTAVACETYLGRPLSSLPKPDALQDIIAPVNVIHKKFLQNLHSQLPSGTRLCLAVPAWHLGNGRFKHLPVVGQLGSIGYRQLASKYAPKDDLIYYREDQIVGRQLLMLETV